MLSSIINPRMQNAAAVQSTRDIQRFLETIKEHLLIIPVPT